MHTPAWAAHSLPSKTMPWLHTASSLQPSMPKIRRWEGLLAMQEHTAHQSRLCCLLPSCALAKGSPDTTPSYPAPHAKCSSLDYQPRSVFNTALHKGRKGRGQRSTSSWWYFLLKIIVLIPCLSSSWIICATSGMWFQLLWNLVAKAELINCKLSCCWVQPANHVWAISPENFVCWLKIIAELPPALPSSLPATKEAPIVRMGQGRQQQEPTFSCALLQVPQERRLREGEQCGSHLLSVKVMFETARGRAPEEPC